VSVFISIPSELGLKVRKKIEQQGIHFELKIVATDLVLKLLLLFVNFMAFANFVADQKY